jgi:hypothetical protein
VLKNILSLASKLLPQPLSLTTLAAIVIYQSGEFPLRKR